MNNILIFLNISLSNLVFKSNIPWLFVIISAVLSLVATKVGSIFPDYQQKITNGDINKNTVITAILILFSGAVLGMISTYIQGYTRCKINKRIFDTVWGKILTLPVSVFYKINPRELISRATSDTTSLGDIFVTIIINVLTNIFSLYLSLKYIIGYNKTLFYIQLSVIPFLIILKIIQGRIMFVYSYNQQKKLASLTEYLSQILVNIPLVKVFAKEKYEKEHGSEVIKEYNKSRYKLQILDTIFGSFDDISTVVNTIISVMVGAYFIKEHKINVGIWISYYMYSQNINTSILMFVQLWPLLKSSQGSIERVCDFMDTESETYGGIEIGELEKDIVFNNVHFSYGGKEILKGIDLVIPKGKFTAIVGGSGAGKTTLLGLIERFFDVERGNIYYGKDDIKDLNLSKWRGMFSYLTQEVSLFRGSIRENISYGLDYIPTDEELILASKKANIYDKIVELGGLDAELSEGGMDISGGERQRIAFARVILSRAKFVLLDEATSNLDVKSEHIILDSLSNVCKEKTVIAIAHRIKTVERADQIVVMDEGEIISCGSHSQLMISCPKYKKIVESELLDDVSKNICQNSILEEGDEL